MMQSVSDLDLFFMCITTLASLCRSKFYKAFHIFIEKTFVFYYLLLKCRLSYFGYAFLECLMLFWLKLNKLAES